MESNESDSAHSTRRYLTAKKVAQILGLAENTIWTWKVTGRGPPFVQLNGCVRWPEDELQKWVDQRLARTAEEQIALTPRRPRRARAAK